MKRFTPFGQAMVMVLLGSVTLVSLSFTLGVVKASVSQRAGLRMLDWAARLLGDRRPHQRDEWLAMLAGAPEADVVLTVAERRRLAAGFVIAAIRMRLGDIARPAWHPVDRVLSSEDRTRTTITLIVGALVVYLVHDDGFHGFITGDWEPTVAVGVSLNLLAKWLRRRRGIELTARADNNGED